jgi:hypothetical protein
MTACFSATSTNASCNTFFSTGGNQACQVCLTVGAQDGGTGTGALLFDYAGALIDVNWGGCVALVDPTSGPACAQAFEPLDQCDIQTCALNPACVTEPLYEECIGIANGAGGACAAESAALSACGSFEADGGALASGECSTDTDVVNVICGTGP